MSLTDSIAQSIASVESGGNPNALSYRNNNPGNLRSWGSNPIVNGYAQFPTLQAGWDALYSQINLNISRGLTLVEFFAGKPGVYAGFAPGGSGGNDPQSYAAFVAGQVGIDPNTPLNALGSTAAPSIDPTTGLPAIDPTTGLPPDTSPAGSIDWATIGLVGLGALVLFYIFNSLSD
jgi:hypothetical protein